MGSLLHWPIMHQLERTFRNQIQQFMVIGKNGEAALMVNQSGELYWFGKLTFGPGTKNTKETKDETRISNIEPTRLLPDRTDIVEMAHGEGVVVLLTKPGQLYTFGYNYDGQLGPGLELGQIYFKPQLIECKQQLKFVSIRCGDGHTLARTEEGRVWAWGRNDWGQTGMAKKPCSLEFHKIDLPTEVRVKEMACGLYHSVVLTELGEVFTWGCNQYKQLARSKKQKEKDFPRHKAMPIVMDNESDDLYTSKFIGIAAGRSHTLLLTATGDVYGHGNNLYGQLGYLGKYKNKWQKIENLPKIKEIASHYNTDLSIGFTSELYECYVWGHLNNGTKETSIPLKLYNLSKDWPYAHYSLHKNTPNSFTVQDYLTQKEAKPCESNPQSSLLLERMCQMFDNPDNNPDIKFMVHGEPILAHRSVLKLVSPYLLAQTLPETETNGAMDGRAPIVVMVNNLLEDCSHSTFRAYLRFLYTDIVDLDSDQEAIEIFRIARNFQETRLEDRCLQWMCHHLAVDNFFKYYKLMDEYQLRTIQQQHCVQFKQRVLEFVVQNELEITKHFCLFVVQSDTARDLQSWNGLWNRLQNDIKEYRHNLGQ